MELTLYDSVLQPVHAGSVNSHAALSGKLLFLFAK